MLEILKKYFGYDSFRPQQEKIISHVLENKDALVVMPTGGGKSLCYQLPALMLPGITLVVSPLIALMKDQVDALNQNGIESAFLNSSQDMDEQITVMNRAVRNELKLLYVAPERVATDGFLNLLNKIQVSLIAIDEAHCISEWGHDFRPDYRNLKNLRQYLPDVPVVALTATATEQVQEDILRQLNFDRHEIFGSSFNRANLHYAVLDKSQQKDKFFEYLNKYSGESVIVYCFSRKDTEAVTDTLNGLGYKALPYHAGMNKEQRTKNQEAFIRDEVNIIVATIAFGMGINKPDVRLVVHMAVPKSIENYYQETGRAGRDGLPSECVMFYSLKDAVMQKNFFYTITDPEEQARAFSKLEDMLRFTRVSSCRRKFLLGYFGEEMNIDNCANCDTCLNEQKEFDATEVSQKIISSVLKTGQRFGKNYVIEVLMGSKSSKVIENSHNTLSVYGIEQNYSKKDLIKLFNYLIDRGYLIETSGMYPTLQVSNLGIGFLRERKSISLPAIVSEPDSKKVKYKNSEIENYDLFEKLRALRKELADTRGVPPYIIFGNATLSEICKFLPQSMESLSSIHGIGEQKLKEFGREILDVVIPYATEHNLQEIKVSTPLPTKSSPAKGDSLSKTKLLVNKKLSLKDIAEIREFTIDTIVAHIESIKRAGEELDIEYLKPEENRFAVIKEAFDKTDGLYLSKVKEMLGDEYSYTELRLARIFLEN